MKLDFPIVIAWLLLAAAAQEVIPALPWGNGAKIPLLPAIVIYYALERDLRIAIFVALWAGILNDALAGLPIVTSAAFFALLTLLIASLRPLISEGSALPAILFASFGGFLLYLLQGLVIWSHSLFNIPCPLSFRDAFCITLANIVLVPIIIRLARAVDLRAGNTKQRKEVHS